MADVTYFVNNHHDVANLYNEEVKSLMIIGSMASCVLASLTGYQRVLFSYNNFDQVSSLVYFLSQSPNSTEQSLRALEAALSSIARFLL